ncbi:hypothetical protein LMG32289_04271 [Cupriavidus pampae]|uniref:Uncharacterized protein n=1 Tax=Cupriavidus pampae TaxID=659251 RepID=A0ABN7YZN1_9BURK|nr:hypothetical protein LMG32289_04271 [Cupriavidus pampae]
MQEVQRTTVVLPDDNRPRLKKSRETLITNRHRAGHVWIELNDRRQSHAIPGKCRYCQHRFSRFVVTDFLANTVPPYLNH